MSERNASTIVHQQQISTHRQQLTPNASRVLSDPGIGTQNGDYYFLPQTGKTHDQSLDEGDEGKDPWNKLELGNSCNIYDDTSIPSSDTQDLRGATANEDMDGYFIPQNETDEYNVRLSEYHLYEYTE